MHHDGDPLGWKDRFLPREMLMNRMDMACFYGTAFGILSLRAE